MAVIPKLSPLPYNERKRPRHMWARTFFAARDSILERRHETARWMARVNIP
jgi:hypothetical protein